MRAIYRPEIPIRGCYGIEEFHPGQSVACSQWLPRAVPIHIQTSHGIVNTTVDQSVNGNTWTPIGSFLLDAGTASITSSNEGTTDD